MVNAVKTQHTGIDLSDTVLNEMIDLLNTHLATVFDLYSQTKQAHWNVKGIHFIELHKLFDSLAEEVLEYVDMVAERATALGGDAVGTARAAAKNSKLDEFPLEGREGKEMVKLLVERYAHYGNLARTAIDTADDAGDQATADLFTEITRGMDKKLYFLQAHLGA
jgi:starvation-inducible DNA-binding protein